MAAAGSLESGLGGGLKPSGDSMAEGKRVAVIAVHGVADQPPDSTVRAIAVAPFKRGSVNVVPGKRRTSHVPTICAFTG